MEKNGGKHHKYTRKSVKRSKSTGILSIPELRHAFDFIDAFIAKNIKKPLSELVAMLQKEWKKVFYKTLSKQDAMDYVKHMKSLLTRRPLSQTIKKGRKKHGGYCEALSGAPLDYEMRPGIPDEHIYAKVPAYIGSGFDNGKIQHPEMGISKDPVSGQTQYPTSTMSEVPVQKGGKTHRRRAKTNRQHKMRGGLFSGAVLDQAFMRPILSSIPPSIGQNAESSWRGQSTGPSSDVISPAYKYAMSPRFS